MTASVIVAIIFGALGAVVNLALVMWRGGQLASDLGAIRRAQDASIEESKREHAETRREVASLREHRVASDATAEHHRADLDALKDALRDLRADHKAVAQEIVTTRHDLRAEMQTALAKLAAELMEAVRAARSTRRGS